MTAILSPEDELIRLRARLAERERELAGVREMAHDTEAAAASRLRAAKAEIAALQQALADALAPDAFDVTERMDAAAESAVAAPDPVPMRTVPRRPWSRAALLPAWRAMRPVARPALWRLRSFFTAEAMRELAALRAQQDQARELLERAMQSRTAPPPVAPTPASQPTYGAGLGDTPAERWLLTLVLEGGQPA